MTQPDEQRLVIGATTISVDSSGTLIRFSSGPDVPGAPEDTDDYRATAQRYGYGADTLRLCIEHEIMHVALAHWLGLSESPTMRAVRYDQPDADRDLRDLEEAAVLAIQHYALAAGCDIRSLFQAASLQSPSRTASNGVRTA